MHLLIYIKILKIIIVIIIIKLIIIITIIVAIIIKLIIIVITATISTPHLLCPAYTSRWGGPTLSNRIGAK